MRTLMGGYLISLALLSFNTLGQSASKILSARSTGLGNITALEKDEWSILNNIAGLSQSENTIAFSYELRPALPSTNRFAALANYSTSIGTFGGCVFRFGDEIYNEQLVAFGYTNSIGNTSLGIRASYIQYRAEGFGTYSAIGLDFGGITKLSDVVYIGAWIQNINQPKINFSNREKAPMKLFLTLGVRPNEKFLIVTEFEKDILYPTIWKTGLEYCILKKFYARAGININPDSFFAGVGFKSWKMKIDYSFQGFTAIGSSHQGTASILIFNKKDK